MYKVTKNSINYNCKSIYNIGPITKSYKLVLMHAYCTESCRRWPLLFIIHVSITSVKVFITPAPLPNPIS